LIDDHLAVGDYARIACAALQCTGITLFAHSARRSAYKPGEVAKANSRESQACLRYILESLPQITAPKVTKQGCRRSDRLLRLIEKDISDGRRLVNDYHALSGRKIFLQFRKVFR
jgi:hypothetical protein